MSNNIQLEQLAEVLLNLPIDRSFTYLAPPDQPLSVGARVLVPFGKKFLKGCVVAIKKDVCFSKKKLKKIAKVIDAQPIFGRQQLRLARWLAENTLCSVGEALATILPSAPPAKKKQTDMADSIQPEQHKNLPEPTPQQANAIAAILSGTEKRFYLHGVTGSGKTLIYLMCAKHMIDNGGSVIYLVPEISLTHQLLEEVAAIFGNKMAVMHSGLKPSQRLIQWKLIQSGEKKIVIGARSAVLAPLENIALIIIDEEHDGSYKSSSSPRYHARQLAMFRCRQQKAKLLLGSATPSVESYYFGQKNFFKWIRLEQRAAGGDSADVKVVNLKNENRIISQILETAIREAADRGKQSLLFLNRRGFSYYFHCRSCHFELKCPRCSVSLTLHRQNNRLLCHYCGFQKTPIRQCPSCASLDVGYSGFGTEQVESELVSLFPGLRIARVDADMARKKGQVEAIFKQFQQQELDILLGTQMIAKGVNFPALQVVGVVLADTALRLPDFRSAERTFSLLVQSAGRTGRFNKNGQVIIQTYRPFEPTITMAAKNDWKAFYQREIKLRKKLYFPPFCRLVRITVRGPIPAKIVELTTNCYNYLKKTLPDEFDILGPAPAPIERINRNYRYHIIIRGKVLQPVQSALNSLRNKIKTPSAFYLEIDFDPQNLL